MAFTVDAVTDAFEYHAKEVERRDEEINIVFAVMKLASVREGGSEEIYSQEECCSRERHSVKRLIMSLDFKLNCYFDTKKAFIL